MTGTTEILSQNSTMHIVSEKIAALRNHIIANFFSFHANTFSTIGKLA
jgi:hypothetical protein